MKTLKIAVLVMTLMLIVQAALAGKGPDDVNRLITKAEKTRLKAAKAGFEWTATAGLIKQAKAAAEKGDKKQAEILANKALRQAENSLKQAKYADEHWQDYTPK